jgi:excisionase family DNA binding protein
MRGQKRGKRVEEYLTIFEVARITRYAVGTLRKFVLRRKVPFHKWGRSLRFRRSELELWMKSGGPEAAPLPGEGQIPLFPEEEA